MHPSFAASGDARERFKAGQCLIVLATGLSGEHRQEAVPFIGSQPPCVPSCGERHEQVYMGQMRKQEPR